jgi:integrase
LEGFIASNPPKLGLLNENAVTILRGQIGKHHRRVFTYKGEPFAKAGTKAYKNALKRAGINNFRFHDLRHTWASWHVQARTPLNVLQELGGWSDYSMVLRYAHLAPEHLAKFAGNVDTFSTHNNKGIKLKAV